MSVLLLLSTGGSQLNSSLLEPKVLTFIDLFVGMNDLENAVGKRNVDLQNAFGRSLLLPLLQQILFHVLQSPLLKANPNDALQYVAAQFESGDLSQFDLVRLACAVDWECVFVVRRGCRG